MGSRVRKIKVVIWGFGVMGSGIAKMLLNKKGVEIVGICTRHPDKIDKKLYDKLYKNNDGQKPLIKSMIEDVISEKSCDVVFLTTDSFVKNLFDKIKYCVEKKINVITTAEEMVYPKAQSPELAEEIDKLAKENDVTVLGTGINPGFVLDLLIIALTGTCESVEKIKAQRINDLSPFGPAVMNEMSIGTSVSTFNKKNKEGTLVGHVGFPESMYMISEAIGWKLDKIKQTKKAIVSNVIRKTPYADVKPGHIAGVRQRAFGYVDDKIRIELDHPQQVLPSLENIDTGDYIWIKGTPDINLVMKPEIPGGIGTIAMCVNMMPHVLNAEPGLATMLDLPVPRAIMCDVRDLLKPHGKFK